MANLQDTDELLNELLNENPKKYHENINKCYVKGMGAGLGVLFNTKHKPEGIEECLIKSEYKKAYILGLNHVVQEIIN